MIRSFKGRALPKPGDKVKVYRRLTGADSKRVKWSLMNTRTGLVVAHADELLLYDVDLRVREAGRRKVVATGRKNVHAFAVGTLGTLGGPEPDLAVTEVRYNPYKTGHFYDDRGDYVQGIPLAHLDSQGKMWA